MGGVWAIGAENVVPTINTEFETPLHHRATLSVLLRQRRGLDANTVAGVGQRDCPAERTASPCACIAPRFSSFFQKVMLPWSRSSSMSMRSSCSPAPCFPSRQEVLAISCLKTGRSASL